MTSSDKPIGNERHGAQAVLPKAQFDL
ncbi:MAG: hypothetical protein RLY65_2017, partial [Pseudomonadota bacterium]